MIGPLLVAFIVVPLLEIYVIVQVGQVIGAWWTVFALLAESAFGAWLVRREGAKAWRRLVGELAQGRAPTVAVADGAVILLGGVLLLTPGFLTDLLGFLCVIPVTRPLMRKALLGWLTHRRGGTLTGPSTEHSVIEGHVAEPPPDQR
ncbi:MAG: protein FxsA [Frankiales bacterium]|jgi:UPF0716 protein FxsA|nr:protein FxsA [Frankiales bacterium]MDX6212219.1 protein FxsA [Frankiales bacterium]MDX6221295.1 protein FxsA [Frankiales bacterium]